MKNIINSDVSHNEQQPWKTKTAIGVLLMQLYKAECSVKQMDGEDFAIWWIDKWRDPDPRDTDAWQDESLWRQCARHLHLLLSINTPEVASRIAPLLGVWTDEPIPEHYDDASEPIRNLLSETYFSADEPPYELYLWQKPLRYSSRKTSETVHGRNV